MGRVARAEALESDRGKKGKREKKDSNEGEGKRSKKWRWVLAVLLVLAIISAGLVYIFERVDAEWTESAYLASATPQLSVYTINEDGVAEKIWHTYFGDAKISEYGLATRGGEVTVHNMGRLVDGKRFYRVEGSGVQSSADDGEALYVSEDNLTLRRNDVVREKEMYVRTPATIYVNSAGPSIASFAPKSTCLKVKGYKGLTEDGEVKKYKVEYTDPDGTTGEGYVDRKYLVRTQESADAVYNDNGIFDVASGDNYSSELYGGKAASLDYYPFDKGEIEGKELLEDAKAMYINGAAAVNPKSYVKLIEKTNCNAVVIDIKDGYLAYQSKVAEEVSPTSYGTAYSTVEEFASGVKEYRKTGAYLIGRIVVFNDSLYAEDHPEDCIKYGKNSGWPSAYSRDVWEYNVRLAIEAVEEFGFDEIQFDYVRFPENAYDMSASGKADFRNKYDEEKGQAVQNFCMYAADQIHEAGAYFSVDVFGESAYGYMTAYGQYWPGISNVVDAISAMPYTDHMGVDGAWEKPYSTVLSWGKRAKAQQDKLEYPAVARTWITGYDTPNWAPEVDYDNKMLKDQVKALNKAGLDGGFIPWNAASSLEKYKEYSGVWK